MKPSKNAAPDRTYGFREQIEALVDASPLRHATPRQVKGREGEWRTGYARGYHPNIRANWFTRDDAWVFRYLVEDNETSDTDRRQSPIAKKKPAKPPLTTR